MDVSAHADQDVLLNIWFISVIVLCLCLLNFDLPIDTSVDKDWLVVVLFSLLVRFTVLSSMIYCVLGT